MPSTWIVFARFEGGKRVFSLVIDKDMKVLIEGKEDEYQLIQANRGCFTCYPDYGNVWFHEFFIVKAQQKKRHTDYSDIVFSTLSPNDDGDAFEISQKMVIHTHIDEELLQRIINGYSKELCVKSEIAAEIIIFDFLQHDTPFTIDAARYALRTLPLDSDVRMALALKTGLRMNNMKVY